MLRSADPTAKARTTRECGETDSRDRDDYEPAFRRSTGGKTRAYENYECYSWASAIPQFSSPRAREATFVPQEYCGIFAKWHNDGHKRWVQTSVGFQEGFQAQPK